VGVKCRGRRHSGRFTLVARAMNYWCMCTDDRPLHKVPVEDELIETRGIYKTLLPGASNAFSYANEEYASSNEPIAWQSHYGDRIIKDATSRVVARKPRRRIDKPRSMTEDDPCEAARTFTSQLGEQLRCLSCVRCHRSPGHEVCTSKANVRKELISSVQIIKEGFEVGVEYAIGEVVEYHSQRLRSWIPAKVLGSYGNGKYRLDCKPYASSEHIRRPKATARVNSWLSADGGFAAAGMGQGFCVGEAVEYNSKTQGGWIAARVLGRNMDGTYNLDIKPDAVPSKIRRQSSAQAGLFQTIVPDYLMEPMQVKQHEVTNATEGSKDTQCDPQLLCPSRASRRLRLLCSTTALMCPSLTPESLTDEHADHHHDGGCHFAQPLASSSVLN